MFNSKTVLIVGAGASAEVNLPVGIGLKDEIASILNFQFNDVGWVTSGDKIVYQALNSCIQRMNPVRQIGPYIETARRIHNAMPLASSIDNFIDVHQGDDKIELCGKLAIARAILLAEKNSLLYFDPLQQRNTIDFQALGNTWFTSFGRLLTENCRVEQLEKRLSSIILVVFNYDRCIEHFLYHFLQTYYGIEPNHAAKIVRDIKIFHPYGTVGALPWYGKDPSVKFGAEPSANQLSEIAGELKTFTEGTDPNSSDVLAIRAGLTEADMVLFLGFAFHRLNLDLIRPPQHSHQHPNKVRYFGSAHKISPSDTKVVLSNLMELGGATEQNIALRNDLTCSQLFHEYHRSLALS